MYHVNCEKCKWFIHRCGLSWQVPQKGQDRFWKEWDRVLSYLKSWKGHTINRLAATHQNHSHFSINSICNILGVEGREKGGPYPFYFIFTNVISVSFPPLLHIYQSIFHVSFIWINNPSHFLWLQITSQVKETEINEALL